VPASQPSSSQVPFTEPMTLQVDDPIELRRTPSVSPVPPFVKNLQRNSNSPHGSYGHSHLSVEEAAHMSRQERFSVVTHPGDAAEDQLWVDADVEEYSDEEEELYKRHQPRSRHEKVRCLA